MKPLHIRSAFLLSITVAFLRSVSRKLLSADRKLPGHPKGSPGENEELFYLAFGDTGEHRLVRAFVARGSKAYIDNTVQDVIDIVWDKCHHGSTFTGIYHSDLGELFLDGRWVALDELPPDEARDAREMLARLDEYLSRH